MADQKSEVEMVLTVGGNTAKGLEDELKRARELYEAEKKIREEREARKNTFDPAAEAKKRYERKQQEQQIRDEYESRYGPEREPFDPARAARERMQKEEQARAAQEEYEKLKGPFDPAAEAKKRVDELMKRQREEAAIQAEMDKIYSPNTGGAAMGLLGARAAGYAYMASGAIGSAAGIMGRTDRLYSAQETYADVADEIVKTIPVVGSLAGAFAKLQRAMSGADVAAAELERGLERRSLIAEKNRAIRQAGIGAREQIAGFNLAAGDAQAEALAARGFADFANANAGQFVSTETFIGRENDSTRGAMLALEQARFGAAPAESALTRRRDELARAKTESDLAQQRAAEATAAADRAAAQESAALRERDIARRVGGNARLAGVAGLLTGNAGLVGAGMAGRDMVNRADLQYDAANVNLRDTSRRSAESNGDATEALARYQQKLMALRDAELQAANKRLDLAKAELGVLQNRESLARESLAQQRGGARQLADMTPNQRAYLMQAAQQLQQSGYGSLNPEQRQVLSGNALTAEWAEKQAIAYGGAMPEAAALNRIAGNVADGVGSAESAVRKAAEEAVRKSAEAQAKAVEQIAAAQQQFATAIAKAIIDGLAATKQSVEANVSANFAKMNAQS